MGFLFCFFERSFVKDLSNSLKTFIILQHCCKIIGVQGLCSAFWGFKGTFFKKFPSDFNFFKNCKFNLERQLERFFVKNPSNSLKSRIAALHPSHFATMLQNYKSFEKVWEIFYKKSSKNYNFYQEYNSIASLLYGSNRTSNLERLLWLFFEGNNHVHQDIECQ